MKREEKTLKTKRALADALKRHMETTPVSQITISDLIGDCDFNRNTFYYHFEDIYALLKWTLEADVIQVVRQFDLLVDSEDAIAFILQYIRENKHILNCAIDSMGIGELKRFFSADFHTIIENLIFRAQEELRVRVSEEYKRFLIQMYTEMIAGMLIEWIRGRDEMSEETFTAYLSDSIQISLTELLRKKGTPLN